MSEKKIYTVIGVFDDTGEVVCRNAPATDRYTAMQDFAKYFEGNSDLQVLGVIAADVTIMPASEEGRSAYASDLLPANDDGPAEGEGPNQEYDALIKNAVWKGKRIRGNIYGDKKERFRDGVEITTSVVSHGYNLEIYHTENSVYKVEWAGKP